MKPCSVELVLGDVSADGVGTFNGLITLLLIMVHTSKNPSELSAKHNELLKQVETQFVTANYCSTLLLVNTNCRIGNSKPLFCLGLGCQPFVMGMDHRGRVARLLRG